MMDYSWAAAPTGQVNADDLGPVRQLLEQAGLWGQVAPSGFDAGGARDLAGQRGAVNWDALQGYKLGRKQIGDNLFEAALSDPTGKTLTTQQYQGSKDSWLDNVMEVVVPAALAWMGGTAIAGGGAGAAGASSGGAAGGGATNAALIDSALNSAGYGASSAGAGLGAYESGAGLLGSAAANTNATNPALIDSALGTPGYGASSAGAGGGAGTGLFGSLSGNISDAMKKIGIPSVGNLGDLAKVGGLLGAVGAGGQQGRGDYTGPMPTITRGNWSPTATPQYMDVAQPSLMPADIKKQANSGLWRYLGGMT
jgi:hypothetical protein